MKSTKFEIHEPLAITPAQKQEVEKLISSMYRRYDSSLQEEFGDRKHRLFLRIMPDSNSYTDNKMIHLGIWTIKPYESVDEVVLAIYYLLGHEAQHCLSTNNKYWVWALKQGVKVLCEEISKRIEGPGARRFLKDSDIENFCNDMKAKGIHITVRSLQQTVHTVINSLEDGRIERIRAFRQITFRKLRKMFRGITWICNPVDRKDTNASMVLFNLMNQVLSLATTGLYQRDFFKFSTDYEEEKMEQLLPIIFGAVKARGTKECMEKGIEILKLLVPDIIESAKVEPLSMSIPLGGKSGEGEGGESGEEGSSSSAGKGDDEKGSSSAGESTDKDDEKDADEGSNAGRKSPGMPSGKEGSYPGSSRTEDSLSDEESSELSSGSFDGSIFGGDELGSSVGSSSDAPEDGSQGSGNGKMSNYDNEDSDGDCTHSDDCADLTDEEVEAFKEEIFRMMQEAAEQSQEEVRANNALVKKPAADVKNTDKKADPTSANDAALRNGEKVHFIENTRQYKVSDPLPSGLYSEAMHFKNQVDELFRNKRDTTIRNRKAGRLDPARITKLGMRQLDIYKKVKKPDEFSGAAFFLVDNSGSMGFGFESKRWFADYALAIIEEGFKDHVPLKIAAFDAGGANAVSHEVIKGFSEKTAFNASYNFCLHGRAGCGNKDGYSIRVATSELLAQPGTKKILFVLSDGVPTDYHGGTAAGLKDVKAAVKEARDAGIEVAAIYFEQPEWRSESEIKNFEYMYERNLVITDPENVGDEVAKMMRKWVMS